ncbi:MAG: GAP family protein [Minisyncoccia bacterium]|jgi:cytochrome c biogenesis protein CcdA
MLPIVLVAAAIDSLNPCAFSVLFLTIAFLFSLGRTRLNVLVVGGTFIFGIFLTYVLIGLGILQALTAFGVSGIIAKIGAVLLIIWGALILVNEFFPAFPIKLKMPESSHKKIAKLMEKASLPAAFVLGIIVGLYEFPCTGGPYLLVLSLLHTRGYFWSGLGYLLLYNVVFVLPLVIFLTLASNRQILDKIQEWRKNNMKGFRIWGSLILILMGFLIFLT